MWSMLAAPRNGILLRPFISPLANADLPFRAAPEQEVYMLLGGIRGKKVKTGGGTRNKCGFTPGRKYGMKVYDGQRVPAGTLLVDQFMVNTLPGWNVRLFSGRKLKAEIHGRVMLTTERVEPDWTMERVETHIKGPNKFENVFKHVVHVLPDKDHQYFKLIEQI